MKFFISLLEQVAVEGYALPEQCKANIHTHQKATAQTLPSLNF